MCDELMQILGLGIIATVAVKKNYKDTVFQLVAEAIFYLI
jgi:hypothetical protein